MNNQHKPYGPYEKYFKRVLDVFCGLAALLVFWWLYIIVAVLVRIKLGSPVLFKQERLGKSGRVYWMYKFRSMRVGAEHMGSGVYSDDRDDRVTRVGRFLRKTSLDEIPQLVNILKGDRGIIGTTKKNIDFSSVVTA